MVFLAEWASVFAVLLFVPPEAVSSPDGIDRRLQPGEVFEMLDGLLGRVGRPDAVGLGVVGLGVAGFDVVEPEVEPDEVAANQSDLKFSCARSWELCRDVG